MNKKLIGILAALVVLGTSNVFALGIGAQAGASPVANGSPAGGGALTFKLDSAAPVFALDVNAWDNSVYVGLTADWWMGNPNLVGNLNLFYGVGGAVGLFGFNSGLGLYAGVRPFIGLNFYIVPIFEIYVDLAWQPGLTVGFYNGGGVTPSVWRFPFNLGFRFWF